MSVPDKTDVLIKLWTLKEDDALFKRLEQDGYSIRRAMSPNITVIYNFIKDNSIQETGASSWADEVLPALINGDCYICVKDQKPVGFMACEATAKNFVGPLGVAESERGHGIARALYITVCKAMLAKGYKYAISGWTHQEALSIFEKCTETVLLPGASEGSYADLL